MNESIWQLAQIIMWLLGTQTIILISVLSMIWSKISKMDDKITRIDKEVAVITATLKFNGYDLTRHKVEGE